MRIRTLQERVHLPYREACLARKITGHWHTWDFHEARIEDVQEDKEREPEVQGVAGREVHERLAQSMEEEELGP